MRYSWETCLSRRSLPHPPPWWRIPHHPPLGNSPRQRWGWRILMHDVWNILWRTFVYFNNLLMTDIMMRSSYFDLEEERSSGWSDSSSIWGRACSSKETDLKLEERKVVSRGLSSTISSSRLSMSYTLVDPPRWPFHIFAIIFWKDHKFVNYFGRTVEEMLKKCFWFCTTQIASHTCNLQDITRIALGGGLSKLSHLCSGWNVGCYLYLLFGIVIREKTQQQGSLLGFGRNVWSSLTCFCICTPAPVPSPGAPTNPPNPPACTFGPTTSPCRRRE